MPPLSIFLLTLFLIPLSAQAQRELSAHRESDTDYLHYEIRFTRKQEIYEISLGNRRTSALREAKLFKEEDLPAATPWRGDVLQQRFESIRDERSIEVNGIARRPSWLYPDDGCYARAAFANRNAYQLFYPVPSKVFAFGNLRVKTANSPRGSVSWWYHVAPVVQVGTTKYVLDPAIEHGRPLELKEWLSTMGDPSKMKVSICYSGTYSPGDSCQKKTDGLELQAKRSLSYYLNLEWNRLRSLGQDPAAVLGN